MPRLLALVGLLAICACSSDPSSIANREPPDIGGVWTVSNEFSQSGTGVTERVERHLVLDLTQDDSIVVGRMGGTIVRCATSSNGDVCNTRILDDAAVSGRVNVDASVRLWWLEDSVYVSVDGKVNAAGMTGAALGTVWNAHRATPLSVAQARTRTGDTVLVRGVVTVNEGAFHPGNVVYLQDGTAGIEVVGLGTGPLLAKGDSVLMRGVAGTDAAGERAILPIAEAPSSRPPEIVWEGTGSVPAPRVVNAVDLITRQYEGTLVTLPSALLHTLVRFAGQVDYGMWFQDVNGADFQVLVHDPVAASVTFDSWTEGRTYDLTGIVGFGVNLTSNSAPLIQIRSPEDRVPR